MSDVHADAIKARLNAFLSASGVVKAYDLDEVAKLPALPSQYVEIHLSRRGGGVRRSSGSFDRTGYRLSTRVVAKTVDNARVMESRTRGALEFWRITLDGDLSTPIQFETADMIAPDDGWFSGLTDWTYVL